MNQNSRPLRHSPLACLLSVAVCCSAAPNARAQCGSDWQPGEGAPGVVSAGSVGASTLWDPDGAGPEDAWVVFGGTLIGAGDVPVSSVAAWDGAEWHAMGDGLAGWPVPALTVFHGELIAAAGNNTFGGTGPANGVAKWNGSSWEALSSAGFQNVVWALTVFEGNLYAGGLFSSAGGAPANNIARWDGDAWSPVGAGLPGGVKALTVHNGDLIAGTGFGARRWDPTSSTWQTFGPNLTGNITSFTNHLGDLIAGGNFQSTPGGQQEEVARWNGASWDTLGNMNDGVNTLTSFNGELFAGGIFTSVEGQPTNRIARWNGFEWSPMPAAGFGIPARGCGTLIAHEDLLYAGGSVTEPSGLAAGAVARWDGSLWSYLGGGIDDVVYDFATYNGDLITAGWFATAGDVVSPGIARRDAEGVWHPMGGVSGASGYVFDLAVYNGSLIATGSFTQIDGVPANSTAKWNGEFWQAFGDVAVGRMLVHDGDLYAPGAFGADERVARWDTVSQSWQAVGAFPPNTGISALTIFNGDLIAGGIGGIGATASVWRWDFDAPGIWQPIGQHLGFSAIQTLGVFDGELLAGGYSDSFGGPPGGLSRLEGDTWAPFHGGLYLGNDNPDEILAVFDLRIFNDELIVAGTFSFAGNQQYTVDGVEANHIVRWDGDEWLALAGSLGTGTNNAAVVLHEHEGDLLMGGWFTMAGGSPNGHWARWGAPSEIACPGDLNGDLAINSTDLNVLLTHFGTGSGGDLNCDGATDSADLNLLLASFGDACS